MQETIMNDPHHCRCFSLHPDYHNQFKQSLKKLGFKEPIFQQNRGQKFGLVKKLDEETQIHVKLLESGIIESEMEYPPDLPFAHLNQEHSYSAHPETEQLLNSTVFTYTKKIIPPITCIKRIIKKAVKPTHWTTALVGIAIVGAIGVGAYYGYKEYKKSKQ